LYKDGKIIWKRTGLSFTKTEIEGEIAKAKGSVSSAGNK